MRTLLTMLLATVMITLAQDKKDPKLDSQAVTQISKEDQYHLRAVTAELTTIQAQINQFADQLHAQDKVKERTDLLSKICGAAKLPVAECTVDTDTGRVSKLEKSVPAASK